MTSQTHYYYTKVMTDLFYELPEVGPITTVTKHKCCLHQNLNKSTIIVRPDSLPHLQVKNTAEFWEFAEGQMLDGLYWEYWYNTGNDKYPNIPINFIMIPLKIEVALTHKKTCIANVTNLH